VLTACDDAKVKGAVLKHLLHGHLAFATNNPKCAHALLLTLHQFHAHYPQLDVLAGAGIGARARGGLWDRYPPYIEPAERQDMRRSPETMAFLHMLRTHLPHGRF
jgi:hypothetical protein